MPENSDFLIWKESYLTGIKAIDEDHLELARIINKLYEACSFRTEKVSEIYISILKDLVNYTNIHFSREEKLMANFNYPGLEAHKKEHDVFKALVLKELKAIKYNKRVEPFNLAKFLKEWVMHHIAIEDNNYKIHFQQIGADVFK
ncbi:MAG: hemerythrin family protein [Spirochaetales bacterium]|nr:hemerythrin family protein [Spirochaetales bacterium]